MPKATTMLVSTYRLASFAVFAFAIVLGGCQGNLGSGSGLQIPAAPPYGQPTGAGGAATQSRQRSLDGAVFLTPDMATLPLPPLDGFAVALQLGTPPPSPSASPTGSALPSATPAHRSASRRAKTRAVGEATAAPSASATPPGAAASPSPAPTPSVAPSAVSSGAAPSATGSPAGIKSLTKLVVYPDDVPTAPTPQASGNVQAYPVRKALVRGFIKPGSDIALYGLGAVKFTIPAEEDITPRGYTVALFAAGRRHHDSLVASDAKASVGAHVVASSSVDGLVLKKNTGYLLVLYADELAATPGAVPSGYPSPGSNPFVTPLPGASGTSGALGGYGGYGAASPPPTAAPTNSH